MGETTDPQVLEGTHTGADELVIDVVDLHMRYGSVEAVRGIDLQVRRGEIFAFLGPNGAGKTTTVEILEGYRKRSGGTVRVRGQDPQRAGPDWRARIGVVLQESQPEHDLTVAECLALYAGYYPAPRDVKETLPSWTCRSGPTPWPAGCRAANVAASTSLWRSSAIPSCCFSTSRRRDSTPRPDAPPGT